MAKKAKVHTSATGGGWKVTQQGERMSQYRTRREAVEQGRRKATRDRVELVIHGRDGRVRSTGRYINDQVSPREEEARVIVKRVIPDAPGTPSVSRAKIAAAARSAFAIKRR